ncbi:MAG: DUF6909 family protein [Spirochaetota bacterium]
MSEQTIEPAEVLERVIPFRFLTPAERKALLPDLAVERYSAGTEIIRQGDIDRRVYLLAAGQVEVCDYSSGRRVRRNLIEPEHYFGEWEPLFDVPRVFGIRTTTDSTCVVLEGERFLELVEHAAAFSQSLGVILRDQQGIFAAFDRFKVELMRGLNQGYLTIAKLLPLYTALQPAIHPLVDSHRIDTSAFAYVIRRLPRNVTRTFAYLLTDELPSVYRDTDALFEKVATDARRRDVWEMLPGSSLVLLRNGISDLVDLISCLCLYAVEARKIRHRFTDAGVVAGLVASPGDLDRLPFDDDERTGLQSIWGDEATRRILEIVKHRETFAVTVRRHSEKYNSRRTELWTKQLAAACRSLLAADPADFPSDYPVHIVSSNTHSVGNCLSSWYSRHGDEMRAWTQSTSHPLAERKWANEYDFLYAVARDFFTAKPEAAEAARSSEVSQGIHRLRETASTGIQVQLIDMDRVCRSDVDPDAVPHGARRRGLIVNIDYAFGAQAEHILRSLLLLFGRNVRSVRLLGKAGALVGNRGDVLVPTGFIEQSGDQLYEMPASYDERLGDVCSSLQARLPTGTVHAGSMLTVDGTLLQNRDMLRFYRYIWSCVGMEMEGAYYYRQYREAQTTGLIDDDVRAGFYYYVSDIPLEHAANLSARLEPHEGVPPLYAITRQVLSTIFAESR